MCSRVSVCVCVRVRICVSVCVCVCVFVGGCGPGGKDIQIFPFRIVPDKHHQLAWSVCQHAYLTHTHTTQNEMLYFAFCQQVNTVHPQPVHPVVCCFRGSGFYFAACVILGEKPDRVMTGLQTHLCRAMTDAVSAPSPRCEPD